MEQLDEGKKNQIDTSDPDAPEDRDEDTTEAIDVETNERDNTITIPIRENTGKGVEHLNMKFDGNRYGTQLINTIEKVIHE